MVLGLLTILFGLLGAHPAWASTFDFSAGLGSDFSVVNEGGLWTVSTAGGDLQLFKGPDDGSVSPSSPIAGGVLSNFLVAGDFTITVDFLLTDFPETTGATQLNESILQLVSSSSGSFSVLRFRVGAADLLEAFVTSAIGARGSMLTTGRYRITRSGASLAASIAAGTSGVFDPIGSASLTSAPLAIRLLGLQGANSGPRSTTALDISFDNLEVLGTIVPEPSIPLLLGCALLGIATRRSRTTP